MSQAPLSPIPGKSYFSIEQSGQEVLFKLTPEDKKSRGKALKTLNTINETLKNPSLSESQRIILVLEANKIQEGFNQKCGILGRIFSRTMKGQVDKVSKEIQSQSQPYRSFIEDFKEPLLVETNNTVDLSEDSKEAISTYIKLAEDLGLEHLENPNLMLASKYFAKIARELQKAVPEELVAATMKRAINKASLRDKDSVIIKQFLLLADTLGCTADATSKDKVSFLLNFKKDLNQAFVIEERLIYLRSAYPRIDDLQELNEIQNCRKELKSEPISWPHVSARLRDLLYENTGSLKPSFESLYQKAEKLGYEGKSIVGAISYLSSLHKIIKELQAQNIFPEDSLNSLENFIYNWIDSSELQNNLSIKNFNLSHFLTTSPKLNDLAAFLCKFPPTSIPSVLSPEKILEKALSIPKSEKTIEFLIDHCSIFTVIDNTHFIEYLFQKGSYQLGYELSKKIQNQSANAQKNYVLSFCKHYTEMKNKLNAEFSKNPEENPLYQYESAFLSLLQNNKDLLSPDETLTACQEACCNSSEDALFLINQLKTLPVPKDQVFAQENLQNSKPALLFLTELIQKNRSDILEFLSNYNFFTVEIQLQNTLVAFAVNEKKWQIAENLSSNKQSYIVFLTSFIKQRRTQPASVKDWASYNNIFAKFMENPQDSQATKQLLKEIFSSNEVVFDSLIPKKSTDTDTYTTGLMKNLNSQDQEEVLKLAISNGHIDLYERLIENKSTLKLDQKKLDQLKAQKFRKNIFGFFLYGRGFSGSREKL